MATTSVSLGEHFTGFVSSQVETGRYKSASDVLRAALRLLEEDEARHAALRRAVADGEASGYLESFDPEALRASMRARHGGAR